MKRLALMRHGEAVAYETELTDQARPLTRRGAADAAAMAMRCRQEYWQPDLIVASPALRTQETAQALARALGIDPTAIVTECRLYQAGSAEWLQIITALPAEVTSALLVGHNPGISQFAQSLMHQEIIPGFAPATILALTVPAESWQQIGDVAAATRFRAAPR